MFSSMRPGSTIYILDKSEKPVVKIGHVENVTQPRAMYPTYNPALSFGTNMQTVVDIAVKVDNEKKDIIGIPSNETLYSKGDFVISETREAMISEVDAMLQNSKNVLDSIDKHKMIIESCEDILKDLNPIYAKDKERDSIIEDLSSKVNNMQNVLTRLEAFLNNTQKNGTN